jgi:hypothetical protein
MTTYSVNYMFYKQPIQQVSSVQLLPIILSLPVQQVSPVKLLLIKIPIHKEFQLTIIIIIRSWIGINYY